MVVLLVDMCVTRQEAENSQQANSPHILLPTTLVERVATYGKGREKQAK